MCQVQSGAGLVENTVTFKVSQFEIKVNQQDVTGETTYVPDRTTGVTYTCAIKYVPKNAHLSWFHNGTELNATTCKNRKCIIENDNVPADVKKAVVYYPAVKSAPSDGMQCKLVAPNLVFGDGGHAQQSGAIKLVTYGTPKFSDSNVTNQRIQVHSGQLSTVVCMDSVDAKHTSKLLLYIGKAMVAESFSGPDNKPLNVAYQFVPHRDNNTALVECKSINRIYGEMSNSSAKLPLRVIYGPEKASVLVTAPSVSPPNETFAAYCHAGKNNPLIKFTWSIHPLRGRGSSYNHTDCSEKGANSWIGGAISHASIMVTPAHGDKEVNITCVVTNPTSDVTVAATAIVQVKVESANTAGNIVVIVVGAVVAGVLALILLMVWVICRKTGRC
ncbi:uncharacterized protein LOC129594501 [Paramacrobiotus metropolitanus]|uniref:uncharacterized protein LOC129594501 n=1 Tax=Paramacrobiotus metropolitanus TaxID=2943436 RepID=UPI002445E380|nr:uncharacterized protein LOC129594501 [Paramacrobiotus metropolitanus]